MMRLFFHDAETRGIVSLSPDYAKAMQLGVPDDSVNEWLVNSVNVPPKHRRHGIATKLMHEVCAAADEEGLRLRLFVVATAGMGGPDNETLRTWYMSFGFAEDPAYQHELPEIARFILVRIPTPKESSS